MADAGREEEIRRFLSKAKDVNELLAVACYKGLATMFRTSHFPVLPKVLAEESISPASWFAQIDSMSNVLAAQIVRRCFEADLCKAVEGITTEEMNQLGDLSFEESTDHGRTRILEIINWSRLLPIVTSSPAIIRDLGLLWYLSSDYDDEEWIPVVSQEFELAELARSVRNLADELEDADMLSSGSGEHQPKVRWRDVFRLPI